MVVGGAGYVGSQSVLHFQSLGWRVVVYDNFSTGHPEYAALSDRAIQGDVLDGPALTSALTSEPLDGIVHCAARALVAESMHDPLLYYRENVGGGVNLLEAVLAAGSPPVVFSSSGTIYGVTSSDPLKETDPQQPINPYGVSKMTVERMLQDVDWSHGLKSVSLRYFNAAGADPAGRVGERHDPETHIIPRLIAAERAVVYGDNYPTPDGTCVRDYVHTQDIACAHAAALEYLWSGGETSLFNLGSGRGTSILELIAAVSEEMDRPLPYDIHPRRPGDPPALVADTSLAERVLGWRPELSDTAAIIKSAVAWHRTEPT